MSTIIDIIDFRDSGPSPVKDFLNLSDTSGLIVCSKATSLICNNMKEKSPLKGTSKPPSITGTHKNSKRRKLY